MIPSALAQRVVHMPAYPVRVQLIGRLSAGLRTAIGAATLEPDDVRCLDTALQQVMNGWSLSVSRFLRVQDDVEALLTRRGVGRPLVERVLVDLEDVFLAGWNHPALLPGERLPVRPSTCTKMLPGK